MRNGITGFGENLSNLLGSQASSPAGSGGAGRSRRGDARS